MPPRGVRGPQTEVSVLAWRRRSGHTLRRLLTEGHILPRRPDRQQGCQSASRFGLRDLRAKGATDMFKTDPNSIRKIQLLLGHNSVQTMEIYLKGLLTEIVRPNERPIITLVR
jgi:integrase